ncbi:MAG: hypothetical protein ACTSRV_16590 [Candidatus Freyarchaeota archaeon]
MAEKRVEIVEDKISDVLKEWEEYARKGNWTVKGYRIVRAPAGPGKLGEEEKDEFMVVYRPHGVLYHHSLGKVSRFFRGLVEGKLYGTRCPKWFSIMLFSADAFLEHLPFVLGYVQIEGTHTTLPIQVITPPTEVWVGQEVEIRFREERRGELMDIYAVPVPGQKPPEWSCLHRDPKNIKDLERYLEDVYKFLEKRFGIKKEDIQKKWEAAAK